jgi:hypothetical protein
MGLRVDLGQAEQARCLAVHEADAALAINHHDPLVHVVEGQFKFAGLGGCADLAALEVVTDDLESPLMAQAEQHGDEGGDGQKQCGH